MFIDEVYIAVVVAVLVVGAGCYLYGFNRGVFQMKQVLSLKDAVRDMDAVYTQSLLRKIEDLKEELNR